MKKLVLWILVAGVLAGCNTMAGFGRDVEKLGDKIERKAEKR
jgi:entericidin A